MVSNIAKKLQSAIHFLDPKSILIHSDLMQGFKINFDKKDRGKFIRDHYDKIAEILEERQVIMPAFNYKFLSLKRKDQFSSEVGVLSEYFRQKISNWMTLDPVFSFTGTGNVDYKDPVKKNTIIDPFDSLSFFHYLYENNSCILHYGSEFKHSTIIHYIERKLGQVPYRYDKIFRGEIIDHENIYNIEYCYHVRPMGKRLDYNWPKLIADLTAENILFSLSEDTTRICYCDTRALVDYLFARIQKDPFYLLDESSLSWVLPMIDKLGRNFLIQDFEPLPEKAT